MGPDTDKLKRTPIVSELGIFGTFLRYYEEERVKRGRKVLDAVCAVSIYIALYSLYIYILLQKYVLSCNRNKACLTKVSSSRVLVFLRVCVSSNGKTPNDVICLTFADGQISAFSFPHFARMTNSDIIL